MDAQAFTLGNVSQIIALQNARTIEWDTLMFKSVNIHEEQSLLLRPPHGLG